MALTIKHFDRSCLTRVAITVGCIHILGSLWNTIGAVYTLITPDPDFGEIYYNNAIITISVASLFAFSGALLLIGVCKKSHLMLLPWLVLEGFGLVLYFTYNSMNLINSDIRSWQKFAVIMVNYSIIGLCVYVWFAILSFYQIIRDENVKPIQDDEENLCGDPYSKQIEAEKMYRPAFVVPITYSYPKLPASQIKY